MPAGAAAKRPAAIGDHDALVFPALDFRSSYREFRRRSRSRGARAGGLGHRARRARGDLGHERAPVGRVAIRRGPHRRGVGEHQPGLPAVRVEIRAQPERFGGPVSGGQIQDLGLLRDAGRSLPRAGIVGEPGKLASERFSQAAAGSWRSKITRPPARSPGPKCSSAASGAGRRARRRSTASSSPNQPINIQYTSGTTGFPKAATLSHRNLLLNGYYTGMCQAFTADDRVCIPVPFYHCFGCVLGTITSVVHGAAMVVPAESFNADGHARRHRKGAGHGALRRADDVHRPVARSHARRAAI